MHRKAQTPAKPRKKQHVLSKAITYEIQTVETLKGLGEGNAFSGRQQHRKFKLINARKAYNRQYVLSRAITKNMKINKNINKARRVCDKAKLP